MDDSRIRKISDILSSFFDSDVIKKTGIYSEFFKNWAEFAGSRCAAHSYVEDIKNNILIISVDHPAWIQLLQFRQHEILEKAKRKFPELSIKGISFRVTSEKNDILKGKNEDAIPVEETILEFQTTEEQVSEMKEDSTIALTDIKDDALRLALERLQLSIKQKNEEEKKSKKSKS